MGSSDTPDFDASFLKELRRLAEAAARAGGAVGRAAFAAPQGVRLKADSSAVTDADVAAQAAVIATLHAARPTDACIGEESAPDDASPTAQSKIRNPKPKIEVVWLIDPIDGTRNFVRGSAAFACSVGAIVDGWPAAGAIYEPLRDTLFSADISSGFFINGLRQEAGASRGPSGPADELVVALPSTATPPVAAIVHACIDRCVIRNVGSAALHLAMVATGEIDAAVLATCKLWDLAAGAALVAAAGGVMVDLHGRALFPLDPHARAADELPCIAAAHPQHVQRLLAQ